MSLETVVLFVVTDIQSAAALVDERLQARVFDESAHLLRIRARIFQKRAHADEAGEKIPAVHARNKARRQNLSVRIIPIIEIAAPLFQLFRLGDIFFETRRRLRLGDHSAFACADVREHRHSHVGRRSHFRGARARFKGKIIRDISRSFPHFGKIRICPHCDRAQDVLILFVELFRLAYLDPAQSEQAHIKRASRRVNGRRQRHDRSRRKQGA